MKFRSAHPLALALTLSLTAFSAQAQSLAGNAYTDTVLVASSADYHPTVMVDPYLLNPWGVALRPPGIGGHIWLSNAGSGTTTTYIGDVNGMPLYQDGLKVVPIAASTQGSPYLPQVTGQVYNAASDRSGQGTEFFVSGPAANFKTDPATPTGITAGPAKFVFVTLEGTINAWRSGTNPGMLEASVVKDFTGDYANRHGLAFTPTLTGVAMSTQAWNGSGSGNRLYATDFANNQIMVFDNQWNDISHQVQFERPADLQNDFSPFNIQELNQRLYVAYAASEFLADEPGEPLRATAHGRVVAYDMEGHIVQDFHDQVPLNAPWGMALAPDNFGTLSGKLLVGNFGDGTIAAYDPSTGAFVDMLRDEQGRVVAIDGLWGLTFGNGVALGQADALYYAAGPRLEEDGVFGRLTVSTVPEPEAWWLMAVGVCVAARMRTSRAHSSRQAAPGGIVPLQTTRGAHHGGQTQLPV